MVVTPTRLLCLADLKNQNKTYEPRPDMLMGIGEVNWETGEFNALVLKQEVDVSGWRTRLDRKETSH